MSSSACTRLAMLFRLSAEASPLIECSSRNSPVSFLRNSASVRAGSLRMVLTSFSPVSARVEERHQLQRIDVHHAEHHVQLRVGVLLRLLQLARQQHAGGDVADRAQHVLDALRPHDAVEVELQVAGFLAAVAVVHRDLELPERVDALHQVLVGAVAPQQLDVLGGGGERRRRHQVLQQLLEGQAGEVVAAEHARQRVRPHRADAIVGVEQEEALAHGLEDVARLLLGVARGALVARAGDLEVGGRGRQHQRGEHAGEQQGAQARGGIRGGVLQRRRRGSPAAPAAAGRCRWRTAGRA